jgi:tetratricopeptide (TPR) repeat protein
MPSNPLRNPLFLSLVLFTILRLMESAAPHPTYGFIHTDLGVAAERKNRREEAIQHYKKAIAYNPDNPLPYEHLGLMAKESGQTERMIAYYKKAAATRQSRRPEVHNELGEYFLKRGEFAGAVEAFRTATDINGNNAQAWFQLGLAYEGEGIYDKAIHSFNKALEQRYPMKEQCVYRVGICYFKAGDLTKVKEAADYLREWGEPVLAGKLKALAQGTAKVPD